MPHVDISDSAGGCTMRSLMWDDQLGYPAITEAPYDASNSSDLVLKPGQASVIKCAVATPSTSTVMKETTLYGTNASASIAMLTQITPEQDIVFFFPEVSHVSGPSTLDPLPSNLKAQTLHMIGGFCHQNRIREEASTRPRK